MIRNLLATIVQAGRRASASLLLPLAAAVAAAFLPIFPGLAEAMQFDRDARSRGEIWRLLTCHLTHFSLDHLAWDLAAFLGLGWFCARELGRRFLPFLGACALTVSLAVWAFLPGLETYRGLSGIDSALFVFLGTTLLVRSLAEGNRARTALAGAALAGFAGKVVFELATGSALFVDTASAGVSPVPLAHAAGALVGLATACGAALNRDEVSEGDGEWAFHALHRLANLGYPVSRGTP